MPTFLRRASSPLPLETERAKKKPIPHAARVALCECNTQRVHTHTPHRHGVLRCVSVRACGFFCSFHSVHSPRLANACFLFRPDPPSRSCVPLLSPVVCFFFFTNRGAIHKSPRKCLSKTGQNAPLLYFSSEGGAPRNVSRDYFPLPTRPPLDWMNFIFGWKRIRSSSRHWCAR